MLPPFALEQGREWVVDAYACSAQLLQSRQVLADLFQQLVGELFLNPVGEAQFHVFPPPGGVTGLLLLSESHLTCHTYPEIGYCALNLYCCRPRPLWPWKERLEEKLGAQQVEVLEIARPGSLVGRIAP